MAIYKKVMHFRIFNSTGQVLNIVQVPNRTGTGQNALSEIKKYG